MYRSNLNKKHKDRLYIRPHNRNSVKISINYSASNLPPDVCFLTSPSVVKETIITQPDTVSVQTSQGDNRL